MEGNVTISLAVVGRALSLAMAVSEQWPDNEKFRRVRDELEAELIRAGALGPATKTEQESK